MNTVGIILVILILILCLIWSYQLRKMFLKVKANLKVGENKPQSMEKANFRRIQQDWGKNILQMIKMNKVNLNEEEEEEKKDEVLLKAKGGEDEEEQLAVATEESRQGNEALKVQVDKYNKGKPKATSTLRVLLKLAKCLFIIEMSNCHTLYQVSRGDYAFPQNMFNRTVVYQILILQLVFTITFITSMSATIYYAGTSRSAGDFQTFLIATIVITIFFTILNYLFRTIHQYYRDSKKVRKQALQEQQQEQNEIEQEKQKQQEEKGEGEGEEGEREEGEKEKEEEKKVSREDELEEKNEKQQDYNQKVGFYKLYRVVALVILQLYLSSSAIDNIVNTPNTVINNIFLVLFLTIVADFFILRIFIIFLVTLFKYIKILTKYKHRVVEILELYDHQRAMEVEMLLWRRDHLQPSLWARFFNKNGLLKQVDEQQNDSLQGFQEEQNSKGSGMMGEEEEMRRKQLEMERLEAERLAREAQEKSQDLEEDEDGEPNSSFIRYEEQQRLNNLSYENEFYMTNSDDVSEKEKQDGNMDIQESGNTHSLQTQNSNDRTSFNKQSKLLLMSLQHMSRMEQLGLSKDLQLTNNNNLLKEVQNQSQMNMDHINSQNSNINQQNLKKKLDGDNLSQISQDMDIKPTFNKGLNNLNISLSMDQNSQHHSDEGQREQDNANNSDSQIMQLNNLLQKNTNKNDSLNTKNLSIGNTLQAGLLQMATQEIKDQNNFMGVTVNKRNQNLNCKGSKGENHFLVKTSSEMKINKKGVQYSLDQKENDEFQKLDFNEIEKMYEKEKKALQGNNSLAKNKKFKYIDENNFDDKMKQKYQEKSQFINKVYDENNKSLLSSQLKAKKVKPLQPKQKPIAKAGERQYQEDVFDYDQFMNQQDKNDLLKQKKEFIKIRQPPKAVDREPPKKPKKKKKKKKVPVLKINNSKSPYTEYLPKLIDKQVKEQKEKETKQKAAQVKLSMMISKNDKSIMNPQQVQKINEIASIYNNNKTIVFDHNKTILLNQTHVVNKSVLPKSLGKQPSHNNNFMNSLAKDDKEKLLLASGNLLDKSEHQSKINSQKKY